MVIVRCIPSDVADDAEHPMAGRRQVVRGGLQDGFVHVDQHDGGAGLGERAGGRRAHAGAGAGDLGDPGR
jgi:hypothetical protein